MIRDERHGPDDRRASRPALPLVPSIPTRWKAAIAGSIVLSAAGLLVAALLFARLGHDADRFATTSRANDVRACQRANAVRVELNRRIPRHEADARNLGRLTLTLGETRRHEARLFDLLGRSFHIRREIHPLVVVYRQASRKDRRIRSDQSRIRFDRVPVVNCARVVQPGN